MNLVFADTFYYFALLNPDDEMHEAAVAFTAAFAGTMVTTAWVLTELGDGLARVPNRALFLGLVAQLRSDGDVFIVSPDAELFEKGLELYSRRPDKDWSLTDCISFAVMQNKSITDALTGDHHFEQAGFKILLKPSP
jgi:predicted nucleic acid-binding protein